ncbi:MAG: ATP-binding protein, partial [Planctomycetota bacterium]
ARMFETFPIERGAILLMTAEGVPGLQVTRIRPGVEATGNIDISRGSLQQLLQKRESFISIQTQSDERASSMHATLRAPASSIMGIPLKVKDRVCGIIFLETGSIAAPFTESHLRLCTAMALHLAVCLENTRLHTELLNHAEFNNSVLRALGSGIMVVDFQSRVLHMNRAAMDILDKTESQMLGRTLNEFPEMSEFHLAVQNTIQNKKPEDRYELKLKTANGSATLGMSTSLLANYMGMVSGVVITFRNLGALRKLEDQVRRAHYLEALAQMAAGVAHEIRNPLNSIRGFTQLVLEHEQTSPVSKEYTQIILEEVDRMNNIVQEMLDFSRQRQFTLLPLSLVSLIEDLVHDMQVESHQAKVVLEVLEPGDDLPNVLGNRDKLRQVFRNIVLNGVQSCKPGGSVTIGFQPVVSQVIDPKTKSLDKTVSLREVVVHINDTGCGMTPETLRKIFDPFFTQKETGTGLGLSISQKIIEQHHARIDVKSEVGNGSTFSVHFPAIKAKE